ncbi:hypothetical protein R3P38DRAFT_3582946 [Favolaschia claudopus]|uniref:Uncharacterized protein n=1 Tax=Favolaschia claudopus TaxID=2862362 RepID=A0AAW0AIG4_9AGAR
MAAIDHDRQASFSANSLVFSAVYFLPTPTNASPLPFHIEIPNSSRVAAALSLHKPHRLGLSALSSLHKVRVGASLDSREHKLTSPSSVQSEEDNESGTDGGWRTNEDESAFGIRPIRDQLGWLVPNFAEQLTGLWRPTESRRLRVHGGSPNKFLILCSSKTSQASPFRVCLNKFRSSESTRSLRESRAPSSLLVTASNNRRPALLCQHHGSMHKQMTAHPMYSNAISTLFMKSARLQWGGIPFSTVLGHNPTGMLVRAQDASSSRPKLVHGSMLAIRTISAPRNATVTFRVATEEFLLATTSATTSEARNGDGDGDKEERGAGWASTISSYSIIASPQPIAFLSCCKSQSSNRMPNHNPDSSPIRDISSKNLQKQLLLTRIPTSWLTSSTQTTLTADSLSSILIALADTHMR